jgi:hypothetical protein
MYIYIYEYEYVCVYTYIYMCTCIYIFIYTCIHSKVSTISDSVNGYDARCKKLPKKLREWPAYGEINSKVIDLQTLIPLLSELSKASIKVCNLCMYIHKYLDVCIHIYDYMYVHV